MLPRCITVTSTKVKIARTSLGVETDRMRELTGMAAAAQSDASEAKRNSTAASRYTASAMASTRQSISSATAAPVATALPPRKWKYSGKQCPSIHVMPPTHIPSSPASARVRSMAIRHLRKSPPSVKSPAPMPNTRAVLAAPALPLPLLRTSRRKIYLEMRMDALNEPSK